EVPQWAVGHFM
nr:ranatensin [Lithobates pipiens]